MPRQARLDAPETLHHIIVRCDEDVYFTELVRYIHHQTETGLNEKYSHREDLSILSIHCFMAMTLSDCQEPACL